MKRFFAVVMWVLLAVVAGVAVFLAGRFGEEPVTEAFREVPGMYPYVMTPQRSSDYKLEDAVADAHDIVEARLKRLRISEEFPTVGLEFDIRESYRGESRGTITVEVQPQYSGGEDGEFYGRMYNFVEGHDYLLVLTREKSVYSERDEYSLTGDIFIPLDDDVGAYMRSNDAALHVEDADALRAAGSVAEYVISLCGELPEGYEPFRYRAAVFTEATKLEDVVAESEYAVIVRARGAFYSAQYQPTETRGCDVIEILKAKVEMPEDEINVTFFAGDVEEGGEYLLLLSRPDDTSNIFAMSSRASVIPLSDKKTVERTLELLAK